METEKELELISIIDRGYVHACMWLSPFIYTQTQYIQENGEPGNPSNNNDRKWDDLINTSTIRYNSTGTDLYNLAYSYFPPHTQESFIRQQIQKVLEFYQNKNQTFYWAFLQSILSLPTDSNNPIATLILKHRELNHTISQILQSEYQAKHWGIAPTLACDLTTPPTGDISNENTLTVNYKDEQVVLEMAEVDLEDEITRNRYLTALTESFLDIKSNNYEKEKADYFKLFQGLKDKPRWRHFVARPRASTSDVDTNNTTKTLTDSTDPFCSTVSLCFNTEEILKQDGVECKYWNPKKMVAVYKVSTQAQWRGQGISSHLLRYTINIAREEGYELMYLHSAPKAVDLYQRVGFRVRSGLDILIFDKPNPNPTTTTTTTTDSDSITTNSRPQ